MTAYTATGWGAERGFAPGKLFLAVTLHVAVMAALLHAAPVELPRAAPVLSVSLLHPGEPEKPVEKQKPPEPEVKPVQKKVTPRPQMSKTTPAPLIQADQTARVEQPVQDLAPVASETRTPVAVTEAASSVPSPAPILPPRFDAAYLDNPRPVYPPLSRRMGEQGKVLLRVAVNASGLPTEVGLHQSSGSPRLDAAAIEAVQRWRFTPARQGDQAIAASVIVPIVFSLKD